MTATTSPVSAMDRAIDAGERAAADEIEDLVVAEEETGPLALREPFDLVVGQELAADEQLEELVDRDVVAAQLAPDLLQLPLVDQSEVERALGELFGGRSAHGRRTSAALPAGMDAPATRSAACPNQTFILLQTPEVRNGSDEIGRDRQPNR